MKSILLYLSFLAFITPVAAGPNGSHTSQAKSFLESLLAKNEEKLIEFTGHRERFFSGSKLNSDFYDFLYKPEPGRNSVVEIANLDKILVKIVKQKNGKIIVLYYPQKYSRQVNNDVKFLQQEWMNKYFACEFTVRGAKLILEQNFCFAETDGPFPAEY